MVPIMEEETWKKIPGLDRHEISTSARVRSPGFKGSARYPYYHEGRKRGNDIVYDIGGDTYTVDELMRWTYGDDVDYEVGHEPGEWTRTLSAYEVREIQQSEGYKPAFAVAEEFRIDSARVRRIWDGDE